jgi:predicted Zn-dependent protease
MKRLSFVFLFCVFILAAAVESRGQSGGGGDFASGDVWGALTEMDKAFEADDGEYTMEDDYYLGRAVAVQILGVYRLYTKDITMSIYLNKICQAIILNSPKPVLFNGYRAAILDSQELNAFATPGGHIFLTKGLIECAGGEDDLAAIIAHEVAHIQLRHAIAVIEEERLAAELSMAADRTAAKASRYASPQERAVLFGRSAAAAAAALMNSGYVQSQEFEADAAAIGLLYRAGYDPAAMVSMLRILEKQQPSRPGGFNKTHPSPSARIARARQVSLPGDGRNTRSYRTSRFTPVR